MGATKATKLTKTKSTQWLGNGWGTAAAEWEYGGFAVEKQTYEWVGRDCNGKVVASSYRRADLLKKLDTIIEANNAEACN